MSHGLDLSEIRAERRLYQMLTVAGGACLCYVRALGELRVNVLQNSDNGFQRVAAVAAVVGIDYLGVLVQQNCFRCGGACVHAEVARALVLRDVRSGNHSLRVARLERFQLGRVLEKRSKTLHLAHVSRAEASGFLHEFVKVGFRSLIRECAAHRHKQVCVLRENYLVVLKVQRFDESRAKLRQVVQRAAQERHVAPYRLTAGKSAYCLVYHRLEYRSSDIGALCAVVEQRLNVALRENAAAGGYRVYGRVFLCKLVQTADIGVEQSRHLVDERAGSASTGAVHALLQTAGEVGYLSVLAAQLDGYVSAGNKLLYSVGAGRDLLNERDPQPL